MRESSEKARLSGGRIEGGSGEATTLIRGATFGSVGIRAGTRRRMLERPVVCPVRSVKGVSGEFASETGIAESME